MHLGFVIWVFQPFETFPKLQPNPQLSSPPTNPNTQPELPLFLVDPPGSTSSNFTFFKGHEYRSGFIQLWTWQCWSIHYGDTTLEIGTYLIRGVERAMEPCQAGGWSVGWWCLFFWGVEKDHWKVMPGRGGSNPMGMVLDGKWWGCEVVISVIRMSSLTLSQYFSLVRWFWEWTFGIAWGVLFESVKGLRPSENIYSILSKS